MLHRIINQFMDYCRFAEFSVRSLQALKCMVMKYIGSGLHFSLFP